MRRSLTCAALLLSQGLAQAHTGYGSGTSSRDFGTLVPDAPPVTIINQSVTGNYGWADGTDADFGDSHRVRAYRFKLASSAYVTITFSGSTNSTSTTLRDGTIKPAFSIFKGLAHLPPITDAPGSADYDSSPISLAYRATLGVPTEGVYRSLDNWRTGGDNQQGPVFDFDAPNGLSTFSYKGHIADGDSSLFGSVPGIMGDGNADGTVTKSIFLEAGDYSIFVGGADYSGQSPTLNTTSYGLTGTISARPISLVAGDPVTGGINYSQQMTMGANVSGNFSSHVGAWSWEDDNLEGWTHTSNWVALTLEKECLLTLTMKRDANVPWPGSGVGEENRLADTASMFPSLTLWRGLDNDGTNEHTYENRGNVDWAEDITYIDHVENGTEPTITRTWLLPAGQYTLALGSKAAATNTNRQGYNVEFSTLSTNATIDPVVAAGGIGYHSTIVAGAGDQGSLSAHVGAWSWEDNELFDASAGEPPVGWTHTSHWSALKLTQEVLFTITMTRDAAVPWPSVAEPNRVADTASMFPSFTLFRNWDNDLVPASFRTRPDIVAAWANYGGVPVDLGDHHTYNNRGRVDWAEDLSYIDHIDNSTADTISRTYRLPAGSYSLAMGSNAAANNPLRQGFKLSYSAVAVTSSVIPGDPGAGGINYSHTLTLGAGETGTIQNHTGGWSWEDTSLFTPGQTPVGWTHTSRWAAVNLKDPCTLTLTMARDTTVPYTGTGNVGGFAAVDAMYPSLTLYRGWDNDGTDSHTYPNRQNIPWAEDLTYMDHFANSTQTTITRSWTLPAGNYSFVLGSNADSITSPPRQGFSAVFTTSAPQFVPPVITKQPISLRLVAGKKAVFSVTATGPNLTYQWQKDGLDVTDGDTLPSSLTIPAVVGTDVGSYTCTVRNAAAAITSAVATLAVSTKPDVDGPLDLPDAMVGEPFFKQITATNNPLSYKLKGALPKGVLFNATTGVLSGKPLKDGTFTVTFTAANAAGTGLPQTDVFVISKMTTGSVGLYTGAIARAPSLNEFLGGSITINTLSTGGFTGSLKLGLKTYPMTGLLAVPALTGSAVVARVGLPNITVAFSINAAAGAVAGTISDGLSTVPFSARQAEVLPGTLVGNYTTALLLDEGDKGKAALPQGHSFGGFKVGTNGAVTGIITLADKTVVTLSGFIEKGGNLTVFRLLYANKGSLLAVLDIDSANDFNLIDSEVSWFKIAEASTSKNRLYKDGFGPLELTAIGRKYVIPAATEIPLGLSPNPAGNAKLTFAEGGLASASVQPDAASIFIEAGSPKVANVLAPNPGIVTLKVTPGKGISFVPGTTGLIAGSFQLLDTDYLNKPVARKADFRGMMVDDGATKKAYGHFILNEMPAAGPPATTALTSKQLSGSVVLEAK